MLVSFLAELLNQEHSTRSIATGHFSDMPDVVLMSATEASPQLQQLRQESWAMGKVYYFVGSPLSSYDMRRVKYDEAGMLFVLADLQPEVDLARPLSFSHSDRALYLPPP